MLPFLPSLLSPALSSLLLLLASAVANSKVPQGIPLKGSPRRGSFSSCPSNFLNSKLSAKCQAKTSPNQQYCTQYRIYCGPSQFPMSHLHPDAFPGYNTYCDRLDTSPCSTRVLGNKGGSHSKRSTPDHTEWHKSGSGFNVRADDNGNLTDNLALFSSGDLWYGMEIILGEEQFAVQLDTGSSDLWLLTTNHSVVLTNTTDLSVSDRYGTTDEVHGNIAFADLQIASDLVIGNQAFLNVSDLGTMPDFDNETFDGILGIAFDSGSIHRAVAQEWGTAAADQLALSPLSSLFAADPDLPNSFDIKLDRSPETDPGTGGTIIFTAHLPGFEAVADAPRLSRVSGGSGSADSQLWSVAMDGMLINGESFSFNQSAIPGAPAGSVVAALDSGSSFAGLPPAAVDAIYGSIPGAILDTSVGAWLVPCDASANVTFVFGGQRFPVHPLDLTVPFAATLTVNDNWDTDITVCTNAYQSLDTPAPTAEDGFDIVLGVAFLQNAYVSFNYGDWDPATKPDGTPFVQLLSTVNTITMWDEFQSVRADTLSQLPLPLAPALIVAYENGTYPSPTTGTNQIDAGLPAATASQSGTGSADNTTSALGSGSDASWVDRHGKAVLGLLGAIFVVCVVCAALLVATVTMLVRRKTD